MPRQLHDLYHVCDTAVRCLADCAAVSDSETNMGGNIAVGSPLSLSLYSPRQEETPNRQIHGYLVDAKVAGCKRGGRCKMGDDIRVVLISKTKTKGQVEA